MNHIDYHGAGFHVFGLHGVTGGECNCGRPGCEALFKHPYVKNWQFTPHWADEQLDAMEQAGQFNTGFGVLCDGYLIIDIDPRNGGDASYEKLCKDTGVNYKAESGFVVATGGGGWHIYFKADPEFGTVKSHREYPGIDFKSSGFVVGAGSLHASGMIYEAEKGHPDEIGSMPSVLLDLLQPQKRNTSSSAEFTLERDISPEQFEQLLSVVDCHDDYHDWISVGMITHDTLGDGGFLIWDKWSQRSDSYDPAVMDAKWHSFGKCRGGARLTFGTLLKMAKDAGWQEPVTFETTLAADSEPSGDIKTGVIDLSTAPGVVGDCIDYINACSRFPRKHLAVMAALQAVGTIAGLSYKDEDFDVSSNLFALGVAGSATGKEAIQQAQGDLLVAAGMGRCIYGTIKSEQELTRNLLRHQVSAYVVDEIGIMLAKINNASKKGSASYLEGIIGKLMEIYSKANGRYILGGDVADDMLKEQNKIIAAINKLVDANEAEAIDRQQLESARKIVEQVQNGSLMEPFLSVTGFTTPVTFNALVDYEQAANGFIGRTMIFEEKDTNPRAKHCFRRPVMPETLKTALVGIRAAGHAQVLPEGRVEAFGERQSVHTTDEALRRLDEVANLLHDYAEYAAETNGFEAVVRRGFEAVLKVSFILAIGDDKLRTVSHVDWAYRLVRQDLDNKLKLASANSAKDAGNASEEVLAKVRHALHKEPMSAAKIRNRYRTLAADHVQQALDWLVSEGEAVAIEVKPQRGAATKVYRLS